MCPRIDLATLHASCIDEGNDMSLSCVRILSALIAEGADVNHVDDSGNSALFVCRRRTPVECGPA